MATPENDNDGTIDQPYTFGAPDDQLNPMEIASLTEHVLDPMLDGHFIDDLYPDQIIDFGDLNN